ncbi:hydrolase [Pigmentiphaga litoralis]|nr:hydrolase [Pigmentiphaga litoralis]
MIAAALALGEDPSVTSFLLDDVLLLAPFTPGTIYCAGVNYRCHVEEMERAHNRAPQPDFRETGFAPWHFLKPGRACVAGTDQPVARPVGCDNLDWEAELAAIIGAPARNVSVEHALSYVAGYANANDLSARDLSRRPQPSQDSPFRFDWLAHKAFEGSCPLGPWITPAHVVGDPQALDIRLWVNGVLKQDSSTARMIYSVAEQISHLSQHRTLYPGDVVLTGTPAGVGNARREFLQPGDRVDVEITHLGRLRTPIH